MSAHWEAASGAITAEGLRAASRAIEERPPHPCRLGQHVVSSRALREDGWYTCGNCLAPVKVKDGQYA